MGQKHFIVCDRCGVEALNTFAKLFHPVGWGEVTFQRCEHRHYGPDIGNHMVKVEGPSTLCPACVEKVRAVLAKESP
jgi:hypothetical protein